jgi:hypothetical protein
MVHKRKISDEDYDNDNEDHHHIKIKKMNIWEQLNNCKDDIKKYNTWVSATKTKNYLIKDPILDWFDLNKKKTNNNFNNKNILFEKGIQFERHVYDYLKNKFPTLYVEVSHSVTDIIKKTANLTKKYIKQGKPIIAQAVLFNDNNNTFGCADLLVRSDWINEIFEIKQLTDDEINIKAPKLNGNYHYRVIDIKWTNLKLCSDGIHLRNEDLIPAYKGQLAIYNCALGNIQGYFPDKTYIMGKSWKYILKNEEYIGYNCFERLGHIEYENNICDMNYIELTCKAIKWIRKLRQEGNDWNVLPKPSVIELYPNMSNNKDEPYTQQKKEIAKKINELTMLWNVGYENRLIAHNNGIFSWKDKNCSASKLGITGNKISKTLDEIININQSTDIIRPNLIKNNINNWQYINENDFYIDFETISIVLNDEINIMNTNNDINSIIFMIGIGYIENNEWKFINIRADECTYNAEKIIINKFIDFINNKTNNPRFFHWSHAEKSFITSTNKRHKNIWNVWLSKIEWIDICNIFKSEPIVVNGSFDFSIKSIASAMYNHKLIKTCWNTNVTNGLHAMVEAIQFYKNNTSLEIMDDIIKYNEIDCKVMWEIISYIRMNHI